MDKTIIASFAILVLVIGIGSNLMFHLAEAKIMLPHVLNSKYTVKEKLLFSHKGNSSEKKFPIIIGSIQLSN